MAPLPVAKPGIGSNGDMQWHELKYNGLTLKYTLGYWGPQPRDGYPLYIGLHGGGASDTFALDDDQWKSMAKFYYYQEAKALGGGAYVACRGVSSFTDQNKLKDEFNLHSRVKIRQP